MNTASIAAAALIAALAFSGTAYAKDQVVPQASHAAKASPRVAEPKRPAKTPILDFTSTGSVIGTGAKTPDRRNAPAQSGIMANPWIFPNSL